MRRFLLALLVSVVLAGCGVVDVTMTREVAAATPTLTPTPTFLAASISPTEELVEFQATATPTPRSTTTPRATTTPEGQLRATMWGPLLSRQGQLAYVANEILWLETAPGSGNFVALDGYITQVHWSEDGSKLLFGWNSTPYPADGGYGPGFPEDYRLYFVASGEIWSLKEKIPGFLSSSSEVEVCSRHEEVNDWASSFMKWSPDGSKIIFRLSANNSLKELLTLVDLHTQTYIVLLPCADHLDYVPFVTDHVFVTQYHCGSPCQVLNGYDFQGNLIWDLPWIVSSQLVLTADGRHIVAMGRLLSDEPQPVTIDLIDINTGAVTPVMPLFDLPENSYFYPFAEPALSPDGNFIGFYYGGEGSGEPFTLYVMDREGYLIERWVGSEVIAWRPGGGPVIRQGMGEAGYQLVYSALDGAAATLITTTANPITVGQWSPDGQFFIYTDGDEVYLWQPGAAEPRLVYSGITKHYDLLRDFAWTPDSQRVYFTINELELWVYEVATGEVRLIAAAEPWFVSAPTS